MAFATPVLIAAAMAMVPAAVGRPAQPSGAGRPADALVEDASIPSVPGVTLAATLRLPASPGRHPVVLIQTGSGANKRGGFLPLEHRLNDAGIATLEFDKRGVGQSSGTFTDSMDDMQADLRAAIVWLRKRPDIDGARIALLGHSQGAAAVPAVAAQDGHIAAIVFLAGPVGERATLFLDGMRAQLVEAGHTPAQADAVAVATGRWMEDRSRGAPAPVLDRARSAVVAAFGRAGFGATEAEAATHVLDSPQLLSMYQVAPGTMLERLRIPVLAVFAARDEIVGAQANAATAALAENAKGLVVEVPAASHGFGYRRADAPPRENPGGGPWLSLLPKALIVDWLKESLIERPQPDDWRLR